jgi:hypothetical protein
VESEKKRIENKQKVKIFSNIKGKSQDQENLGFCKKRDRGYNKTTASKNTNINKKGKILHNPLRFSTMATPLPELRNRLTSTLKFFKPFNEPPTVVLALDSAYVALQPGTK